MPYIEDLMLNLYGNLKIKDLGLKTILKGIPVPNSLRKLHLNFDCCGLSFESLVYLGNLLLTKLPKIEDLFLLLPYNDFKA